MTQIYKGSSGGGGGGSLNTLTGNDANAVSPVSGNIDLIGIGGNYLFKDGSGVIDVNNLYWITQYVVDNSTTPGDNAAYQTIQSAIDAAALAGGGTVAVRYGTYVENPIMAAGVDIVGFSGINIGSNTIINGNVTASYTGTATLSNIAIAENVGSPLLTLGTNGTILFLNNVQIESTNSACVASSNPNSTIVALNSVLSQNGANPFIALSGGTYINNNGIYNGQGSQTANTIVGGEFQQYGGFGGTSFVVSSGGDLNVENFIINTNSGPCITIDDTSSGESRYCGLHANDGTSSGVVVSAAGGSYNAAYCTINSGGTYAISGLGNVQYDHLSLPGTNALDPGLGLNVILTLPISQAVAGSGDAPAGHCYFNSADFSVDSTGFVSSTGSSAIETIDGDFGSMSGTTVTLYAQQATLNAGSTVGFTNSASSSIFNVTDIGNNTIIGRNSGSASPGSNNTAVGFDNLTATGTTNDANCVLGVNCMTSATNSMRCIAIGGNALPSITTGLNLISIGSSAGINYTSSEESNIVISSSGVTGENNTIRIGTQGTGLAEQNACFIAGIIGVSPSSPVPVVIDSSTGQLGVGTATTANYTNVDFSMSPYTVLSTDYYLSVDASGGPISIVFPTSPTFKEQWIIKDRLGVSSTNNITLSAPGTNIDLAPTFVMSANFEAVQLFANTTAYEVF